MEKETDGMRNVFETALDAAQLIDRRPIKTDDGSEYLVIPQTHALQDVTDPHRLPSYINETRQFDDEASFNTYVNAYREEDALICGDYDKDQFFCVLDYHKKLDAAGGVEPAPRTHTRPAGHRATLQLRPSNEWRDWSAFEAAGLITQAEFARFLEENASDVVSPEPNRLIEIARDLEVSTGCKFRQKTDLQSGDRVMYYESEDKVLNNISIPQSIVIEIPLWQGDEPVRLEALFRYRAGEGGLKLAINWRRADHIRQAKFMAIGHSIAEATGVNVLFGR